MNRTMHQRALCLCLSLGLILGLAAAVDSQAADDRAMAPSGKINQTLYWQGHESLKAGQWNQAIERFAELERALRRDEPAAADAALYWQAYAQSKARRSGEAKATVDRLRRDYPGSRWLQEAGGLLAGGEAVDGDSEEQESLADVAVDALLMAPAERALPLLRSVLQGDRPLATKRRALFVLSQIDDPAAQTLLLQSAKAPGELQLEAISMLAMGGSEAGLAALEDIYRSSAEVELRRRVLSAWLLADQPKRVLQAALSDRDGELRLDAVRQLGAMGAEAELKSLLGDSQDPAVQEAAIDGLGIAGSSAALVEIVGSQRPEALRAKALQALGIGDNGERRAALYPSLDTPALREGALKGLLISGDSERLLQLYRQASETEEKRRILRMLTAIGDDTALQAIEATLSAKEQP